MGRIVGVKYLVGSAYKEFKSQGVKETVVLARSYLGNLWFPVASDETVRRFRLGQKLSATLNHTVRYGPFKGVQLSDNSWWGAADRGSMLLGIYEKEVLEALVELSSGRSTFIDVGAADGYYAVGAIRSGYFDNAYCFEISEDGRGAIRANARRNRIEDRIHIYGKAEEGFLDVLLEDFDIDLGSTVLLMDIEGAEFEILKDFEFEKIQHCALIIEVHDWEAPTDFGLVELVRKAERYFNVVWLETGSRDLSRFQELTDWPDDDRWILCSEGRRQVMKWMVLTPN